MPYGGTLAMTRLLAFTGLLLARDIGGQIGLFDTARVGSVQWGVIVQ